MSDLAIDHVTLEDVAVRLVAKPGVPGEAARPAWDELEAALPSMRGRRFYGYFDPEGPRYVACVTSAADDPVGLEGGTLPGGRYARARLSGAPPELYARIGPTFDRMAESVDVDRSRPWLEYYRREDEVDLLVPVIAAEPA